MTRIIRYKLGYLAALLALGALAFFAIDKLGDGPLAVLLVVAILLVPGRVAGVVFRDLFRGRRLLDLRQPEASIPYTQRFIDHIRQHPERKKLLWLTWSFYTPDAEAMALNNLGAAHLELGNFAAAADALKAALTIDPEYPLPHYNLAIERAIAHDNDSAARHAAEAERLGCRRTRIDAVILQAQSLLARLEGRGATVESTGH